eukprot:7382602-Prymnesium_polylepis.2
MNVPSWPSVYECHPTGVAHRHVFTNFFASDPVPSALILSLAYFSVCCAFTSPIRCRSPSAPP